MTRTIFRATLGIALVLGCLGPVFDASFPYLLPPELQKATLNLPPPSLLSELFLASMFVAWGAAFFASTVGMFFFKRWSRTALLASALAVFAFYPALGPTVNSWLSQVLTDASWMLLGATLAISFCEPVSSHFARRDDA